MKVLYIFFLDITSLFCSRSQEEETEEFDGQEVAEDVVAI
jgi:hypothetical protein